MLIHNAGDVFRRAWSVKWMLIAAFFSGLEIALPLLHGVIDLPPGLFAALSFVSVFMAFVSRFIAQKGLSK